MSRDNLPIPPAWRENHPSLQPHVRRAEPTPEERRRLRRWQEARERELLYGYPFGGDMQGPPSEWDF